MSDTKKKNYPISISVHGSPFDRGGADYYYSRGRNPHYYPNGTYHEPRIEHKDMSQEQVNEYNEGYDEAQKLGFKKEY